MAMRFVKFIVAGLLLLNAQPAFASDPVWSSCTTIDSVSGMNEEAPYLEIGSLGDFDGKNYLIIKGTLETPSGGYSYGFVRGGVVGNTQRVELTLIPPKGDAITMISNIYITERFEINQPIKRVDIKLVKSFNWGLSQIDCAL
jgi:hypothetical protein